MADVAARAGVSVPTVSRVVSGTASVSADKRERVELAIRELDFRPSAAARALAHGRSTIVAVLAARVGGYGYSATIEAIHDEARRRGWTVAVCLLESDGDDGEPDLMKILEPILTQRLVGAVVIGFDEIAFTVVPILLKRHRVVLAAGSPSEVASTHQVHLDDYAGAYAATRHLLSVGHRTVHHVAVPGAQLDTGRTGGWRAALRDAGATVPAPWYATWDPAVARGLASSIPRNGSVTAVLCGNDETAVGLMRGLADRGIGVPDEISVVGFDDHPLGRLLSPSLSTVGLNFTQLGVRAVQLLDEVVDPGLADTIPPTLILRESVRDLRSGAAPEPPDPVR
jgi:DNA-binding LacI/PurR family transcriptional regulator